MYCDTPFVQKDKCYKKNSSRRSKHTECDEVCKSYLYCPHSMIFTNASAVSFPQVYVKEQGEITTYSFQTVQLVVTESVPTISFTFQIPKHLCLDVETPIAVNGSGLDPLTLQTLTLLNAVSTNGSTITLTYVPNNSMLISPGTYFLYATLDTKNCAPCESCC